MTTPNSTHRPAARTARASQGLAGRGAGSQRSRPRARGASGWVPQQHGAWAMLVVPWVVGLVLAHRAENLGVGRVLLGPAWVLGYLAFNAATLLTKAAPIRRPRYRRPLISYTALATVAGLGAVLTSAAVLWWAPLGAALVAGVLWLTRHKRERSLLAGVLGVTAGTGVAVVTRFWSPAELTTATPTEVATLALTIGYFLGTVLVVKTMIRERGSRGWLLGSLGYHAVMFAVAVSMLVCGWLGWTWVVLALACLVRAVVEPRLLGRVTVLQIGLVEVVLSALVVLAVLLG